MLAVLIIMAFTIFLAPEDRHLEISWCYIENAFVFRYVLTIKVRLRPLIKIIVLDRGLAVFEIKKFLCHFTFSKFRCKRIIPQTDLASISLGFSRNCNLEGFRPLQRVEFIIFALLRCVVSLSLFRCV